MLSLGVSLGLYFPCERKEITPFELTKIPRSDEFTDQQLIAQELAGIPDYLDILEKGAKIRVEVGEVTSVLAFDSYLSIASVLLLPFDAYRRCYAGISMPSK